MAEVVLKTCTRCKIAQDLSEFSKNKNCDDGLQKKCKRCYKEYYDKNKESILQQGKEYYINNKQNILAKSHEYNVTHKEEISIQKKQYYADNEQEIIKKNKLHYSNNKERIAIRGKKYRDKNHKKIIAQHSKRQNQRRKEDPLYKLKISLRARSGKAIKSKGLKKHETTTQLLSASVEYVKKYLEQKFTDGMAWANHGSGMGKWNIDHVVPVSAFDLLITEERIACFHYLNLHPMWSIDNFIKSGTNKKDYTKEKQQFLMVLRALGEI